MLVYIYIYIYIFIYIYVCEFVDASIHSVCKLHYCIIIFMPAPYFIFYSCFILYNDDKDVLTCLSFYLPSSSTKKPRTQQRHRHGSGLTQRGVRYTGLRLFILPCSFPLVSLIYVCNV